MLVTVSKSVSSMYVLKFKKVFMIALVGLIGWPTSHRPKLSNISQFATETKVYLNDFSSDIFKSLNVDNQMSLSSGLDELLGCPKNAFFNCVIGIYLVSFFFGHPVHMYTYIHF